MGSAIAALMAFNLMCSGTEVSGIDKGGFNLDGQKTQNITLVFRVNLITKRWCQGNCTESLPLFGVTDDIITFEHEEIADAQMLTSASVNRNTGKYARIVKGGNFRDVRLADCERAPYAGMPSRKF